MEPAGDESEDEDHTDGIQVLAGEVSISGDYDGDKDSVSRECTMLKHTIDIPSSHTPAWMWNDQHRRLYP